MSEYGTEGRAEVCVSMSVTRGYDAGWVWRSAFAHCRQVMDPRLPHERRTMKALCPRFIARTTPIRGPLPRRPWLVRRHQVCRVGLEASGQQGHNFGESFAHIIGFHWISTEIIELWCGLVVPKSVAQFPISDPYRGFWRFQLIVIVGSGVDVVKHLGARRRRPVL